LLLSGCNFKEKEQDSTGEKKVLPEINAELPDDKLIWPPYRGDGKVELYANFSDQKLVKRSTEGDYHHMLYQITYEVEKVRRGRFKDKKLVFYCKDKWPTKESGIRVKKLIWPFIKDSTFLFKLKKKGENFTIIGYTAIIRNRRT